MQQNVPVSIQDFINYSTKFLKEKNIPDARLNVELMIGDILKCDRMNLYLNFDKPLSNDEIGILKGYLIRSSKNEPLQYILGRTSFYGYEFIVNSYVLIPRPETELLVEKIIHDIKSDEKEIVSIFEIGAGSGCISIAIAKSLEKDNVSFNIFSIDKSREAIQTAIQNLKLNNVVTGKVKFFEKDVFDIEKLNKNFDYIVSNPPYISNDEYNKLEPVVKDFEPDYALTDFGSGLKFYERIFLIASDEKFKGKIFCEIGFGQKDQLELLLKENNFINYSFYKDYNNIDRVLEVRK